LPTITEDEDEGRESVPIKRVSKPVVSQSEVVIPKATPIAAKTPAKPVAVERR